MNADNRGIRLIDNHLLFFYLSTIASPDKRHWRMFVTELAMLEMKLLHAM